MLFRSLMTYPKLTADGLSGMFISSSQAFCISNTSQYKDEAAQFISYFVNDIEANSILKGERGVPISSAVRENLSENADPVTKKVFDFIDLTGEIASHTEPLQPAGHIEIENMCRRVCEELAFDQITPEEAAAKFRSEANAIFDKEQTSEE